MWVKICANTNLDDALMAAELGADAVGFVFAPSKRQVTAAQVAAMTARLPLGLETVGVFAGQDVEAIAVAVQDAGLQTVQLHGGLDLGLAERLVERLGGAVKVILTAAWNVEGDSAAKVTRDLALAASASDPQRILIDAAVGGASGGLGVSFDWTQARAVFASQPGLRLIVAGGLRPETVGDAIAALRPWGVDVASGVEASPGRKNYDRVREFIEAAKANG